MSVHCETEQLFVPIRNMQYQAIVDAEELVFIGGVCKCWIDIAWKIFRRDLVVH